MTELDLDAVPGVDPERRRTPHRADGQEILHRHDVAAELLPAGDALELAELLERVDANVRVRADAQRDAALENAGDRRGIRLRGSPPSSGRRRSVRPHRRAGRARASEACVACTIVVRGPRQPHSASSSIGRRPCSATHSSISRGCSHAWTCRTRLSRRGVGPELPQPVRRAGTDGVGGKADRDARLGEPLDGVEVLGDRALPEPRQPSPAVGGVEEPKRRSRPRAPPRPLRAPLAAHVVELADRGEAGRTHLAIDVGVQAADPLGRQPLRLGVHAVAPRPEVAAFDPAAQRALERVAVRVDEAGQWQASPRRRV